MSGRAFAPAPEPEQQADLWSFNPTLPADLPKIVLSNEMTAAAVKNLGKVNSRQIDWDNDPVPTSSRNGIFFSESEYVPTKEVMAELRPLKRRDEHAAEG